MESQQWVGRLMLWRSRGTEQSTCYRHTAASSPLEQELMAGLEELSEPGVAAWAPFLRGTCKGSLGQGWDRVSHGMSKIVLDFYPNKHPGVHTDVSMWLTSQ